MDTTLRYPILLEVQDRIEGASFAAFVSLKGRALMRYEDEDYWIDGVFPGALCESGSSKEEALNGFRQAYRLVLEDFAMQSGSLEEFRATVERFVFEETPGEAQAWDEAAAILRQDQSKAGGWLKVTSRYPDPDVMVSPARGANNCKESMELASLHKAA